MNSEIDLKKKVLRGLIEAGCFQLGEFTLKSGAKSPFYIDLRRVISSASLLALVGKAYDSLFQRAKMAPGDFDHLAGIPVAGLPLATALALEAGMSMIFPRMQVKKHGTSRAVEGVWSEGQKILLLDDLITSGTSKIEAIEILRTAGLTVEHLFVLLERGTSGRKDMEKVGVSLQSFAHVDEFFPVCEEIGLIDASKRIELEAYVKES